MPLYNEDCLKVMADFRDDFFDLVVTDCPYHIVSGGCTNDAVKIGRSRSEFDELKYTKDGKLFKHNEIKFSEWLPEVYRVLKPNSHCYIMINPRNLKDLQIEAEKAGFIFQNLIVWDKGNSLPNKYYLNSYELILMLRKGKAKKINNKGTKNILRVPNIIRNKQHPTEKPVELMQILVENSSEGLQKHDDRIIILKPKVPIKQMLEKEGYPFKSKQHAKWVDMYQRNGQTQSIENYTSSAKKDKDIYRPCPQKLLYQFDKSFKIRISDKCCKHLKEEPIDQWRKENGKPYAIVGIMREEGGRRTIAKCLAFNGDKLRAFQPLAPMSKDWEEWFIRTYNVKICDIYYPPYNFVRTGCKGCPFALYLQEELDTLEKFFPNEKKQCELIWAPIYEEYRRIGYRLKPIVNTQIEGQMSIFDYNLGGCVNE